MLQEARILTNIKMTLPPTLIKEVTTSHMQKERILLE
jgi:hypothetical protein